MIAAFPVPGKRCWANYCANYGLPAGLADRTPLLILQWARFDGRFSDDHGHIWNLNRVQIDTGFTFNVDDGKYHESHPRCAAWLRLKVEELKGILSVSLEDWVRPVSRFDYEADLSRTRWFLERNGYDPDATLSPGHPPRLTGTPPQSVPPNPRLPLRDARNGPRRMNS